MSPLDLAILLWGSGVSALLLYPLVHLLGWAIIKFQARSFFQEIPVSVICFTYTQAFLSSVLAGLFGVFVTLFCRETKFWGRRILIRFCETTFFLPVILVVLSLIGVWGNRGWLGSHLPESFFYGWFGILMAHVLLNFSLYFKVVGQSFEELDRTDEKIALSLGASRWITFWRVTFPKLKTSIYQCFWLVFLYCASSFFILLMLGGGPKFTGIETTIYQSIKVDLDIPKAVSLSLIQMFVCLLARVFIKTPKNSGSHSRSKSPTPIYWVYPSIYRSLILICVWIAVGLIVFLPIFNLIISGLPAILKLNTDELFANGINSVLLGIKVSLISTVLAFSAAYIIKHSSQRNLKKWVEVLCMLPISLSTMVFGVALILALSRFAYVSHEKMWWVVGIQSLSVLPIGLRILNESFSKIEDELYFSARSLGAGCWRQLLLLEIPTVCKSVGLVAVTAFGISLGEAGSVLLFESQGKMTLPLWMFKLIGKYQFEEAQAVGVVLLFILIAVFTLKEKWENSN